MTQAEQQYIDLYSQTRQMIAGHSAPVLNALRDKAFEDFKRQGFPHARSSDISTPTCRNSSHPTMD